METNKKELFFKCLDEINAKIDQYQSRMDQIKQSMDANGIKTDYDEDNKGEMLSDFERHTEHLSEAQEMKETLQKVDPQLTNKAVGFGSVVETDERYYFIAVPLGEINMDTGNTIYAISTDAPIYEVLQNKKEGDTFTFNDKEHTIKGVA
ncbi:transcription elongation factor [Zunongwangia sp.]|uniref:transcription elongation factor n=1 Tax=Zunongwangia sp. TaxID=1965325 RepID=UPI003AA9C9A1